MNPPRVREVGDSALLLEFEAAVDPGVNAHALAAAEIMRQASHPGVRDVLSTFHTVAVYYDPLVADVAAIARSLHQASACPAAERRGRHLEVPVVYGQEHGPDLLDVAAFAGCTAQHVVDAHASRDYRVFMLGFLPGFPYLGAVEPRLAMSRRAVPRTHVPAGAVGIAGLQTGIYPCDAPSGWHIIGRTSVEVFNACRDPAALFSPGDSVRFVPVTSLPAPAPAPEPRHPLLDSRQKRGRAPYVTVLQPGLLTTIQDTGRWGHQSLGVPVSGAMDVPAHRLANELVGNAADAATLEITLIGPELRFEQATRIALAGADLQPLVGGKAAASRCTIDCKAGDVLRFGVRQRGARAYLAVAGGFEAAPLFGSRSTHATLGLGGAPGRVSRPGQQLAIGAAAHGPSSRRSRLPGELPLGGARLRVLPGPQEDAFNDSSFAALQRIRFTISAQSNRMGYRLTGGSLPLTTRREMISDATFPGAIQVPPSGEPILLMADRQTTGGYPQIAVVISADLPLAGQLAPGDWVEFQICSRADALRALAEQERTFRGSR